jgi:hypothetical protein
MFRRATPASHLYGVELDASQEPGSVSAVGKLQTVMGSVAITRAKSVIQAIAGDALYQGDTIVTGVDGSVGIAFVDGTKLRLYSSTHLVLDKFVCGTENSVHSTLLRIAKGMFGVIAGKSAGARRLIIDTPFAQIQSTAPGVGIGTLALGILTFSLIKELKAAPNDIALLDDGTIDYNDLKHGIFEIVTRDGKTIVVDDVTKTYWVHKGSSDELVNTPVQMANLHGAYLGAQEIHSQALQDPFIQQYQHAFAQPQSTTASTGSSTSDTILSLNIPQPPAPPLPTITSTNQNGSSGTSTTTTTTVLDILPPPPPPPPTVTPMATFGVEGAPVMGGEGSPIPLQLGVTLNGGAGVSLASLVVSDIPLWATVSDGSHSFTATAGSGNQQVDVHAWDLANLNITAPNDTNFTLTVTATEQDTTGISLPATGTEQVTVNPLAPTVAPVAVTGKGVGSPITLALGIVVNSEAGPNGDGPPHPPNSLSAVTISDIPSGATLSNSHGDTLSIAGGSITFDAAQLAGGVLTGLAITQANSTNL